MTDAMQVIRKIQFGNALELADALYKLINEAQEIDRDAVVYANADGFRANGTALLIERQLTDGSMVYDINLDDAF